MGISRELAYEILELPVGSDPASIRTNYKRLAIKWHPEKHSNSLESRKNFRNLGIAYNVLIDDDYDTDEDDNDMSMADVFEVFQKAFTTSLGTSSNGYESSDNDDRDEDSEDDIHGATFFDILSNRFKPADRIQKPAIQKRIPGLSPEQIEKNANELISEEEKEKRKAEKRKAKKKRRRDKKRNEKDDGDTEPTENNAAKLETDSKKNKKDKKKVRENGEEEFDPTAAFFTEVVNKKKKTGVGVLVDSQTNGADKPPPKPEEEGDELDPVILRSRQLAIRGNQMAQVGEYKNAIGLFSEAIKLYPKDFRYFGNRSYCFDRLESYDKALRDAETSISLDPGWPKGYFRKGRALAGLKLYAEAEQAFMQVVKLDRNCPDASDELKSVRTHQIMEMGFSKRQSEAAIQLHGSVQDALDSLLSGIVEPQCLVSDEEESGLAFINTTSISRTHMTPAPLPSQLHSGSPKDTKMDPSNPEGLCALWVGNVLPEVNDKKLTQIFGKYGTVTKVRTLPEKFCAFINFTNKEAAGNAMKALQGAECGGQRLLIKFPDNPLTNGAVVIKKPNPVPFKPSVVLKPEAPRLQQDVKQKGPVEGNECYFWRTTGCDYGAACIYKHIPAHKGLDRKPWHK